MDKFYYKALLKKSEKLWYEDIEQIEIINEENEERLYLYSYGDKKIELSNVYINCLPMKEFLEKAKLIVFKQDSSKIFDIDYKDSTKNLFGSNAAGHSVGAYGQVNKGFEEEIFQARQGHGFAAERANHLYDRLAGRDSRIIGGDNAKDGADRLLDSIYIQTKYHQNASATLSNCFENGKFRYYTDTGQPMQIEVPADQYDAILAKMKDYIHQGKIDGVSNVEYAMKIIKKVNLHINKPKILRRQGLLNL